MDAPFTVVIPARYASTRLPGKPLRALAGRPMLAHVYDVARRSGAARVIVATDDARIEQAARGFGAEVCMTSPDHASGTDRLAEVADRCDFDDQALIVNLQGDEPLMPPALPRQVADNLAAHPRAAIATLATPLLSAEEFFDPNAVKVVTDEEGFALYFSRAPIPWDRDLLAEQGSPALPIGIAPMRHIGLYAYRAGYLRRHARRAPCALEEAECLEQLRALWHGERIHVAEALQRPGPGVDTEDDLREAERLLQAREEQGR